MTPTDAMPLKLLLVDDEEGIRTVLSMLLTDMGYAASACGRGDEALAVCRELRPAIVLTDIKMPGMDGIELLRRVKAEQPDTEVLLLTGHGDMELAVAGLRHGAGDFLNKPVSGAALEVALERAGQRMAMRAALRRHTEALEELVAERTAALLRSERFAAVGESAAVLAHSIKNIAGALEGTMYVLEKGLELDKREYFEEGWRMVRADVARLRNLALGLLDLGKAPTLEYREVRPASPAEEVLESLRVRAEQAGVRLRLLDEAGERPWLMAPEAVRDCLLNLALNALEALEGAEGTGGADIPDGGWGEIWLSVGKEGRDLVYRVRDNGPGLTATPDGPEGCFHSTKSRGNGIGLFATRRTAREMRAEFGFNPDCRQGTEAYLRLPAGI